jgi:5,10-methylenetetrahydromethanopterin reductase
VPGIRFSLLIQAIDAPDEFVKIARRAEELGFDTLWVADSSLHGRYVYAYLAFAAVHTLRIRLGTGITHPVTRHPAVTVNAIATVDTISRGRAVLGVGAGDRPVRELGLRPASPRTVRDLILLTRELAAGHRISFAGETFRVVDARLRFPSRPDLPIYVAASGPRMLEMGGEVADGLLVQVGVWPPCVEAAVDAIGRGANRTGRAVTELDVSAMVYGSVRDDPRQARDESRPFAAWIPQTVPQYCRIAGIPDADVEAVRRLYRGGELHEAAEAAAVATDEMIDKFTLSGSPAEVRAKVARLVETGIRHITFFPMGSDRAGGVERFARHVMTYFQ